VPYTTLVSGTVITASWANANVRDQVVTPFASSSARSSAITSPVAGMLTYITGTKQLEPYDGSAYVPLAGTMIAFGNRQSDKTFSGTEVGALRLDNVSMRNGYRYLIMSNSLRLFVVTGETGKCNLRFSTAGSAGTGDAILGAVEGNANTAFTPVQSPTLCISYAPGANVTFSCLLTVARSGGSGNVTLNGSASQPIELYVIVAGPDPTDTGVDV
jgi:hypothetical protein